MKLTGTTKVLMTLAMTLGLAHAGTAATFHGIEGGNKFEQVQAFTQKLDSIGYNTVANNENIQNFYYKKFNEKNVDMISFYTVVNKKDAHALIMKNPDFGAYIPFNFLTYKNPNENTTWYGHLDPSLMLDIIGCKDGATKAKFTEMVGKLDKFAAAELKPTKTSKMEFDKPLPKTKITKMVKKFERPDDLEEWVETFVAEHDGAFSKHSFIIAGFIDLKFEMEDMDMDVSSKYDAYWVSSLCHFKFSNSIFNRGYPKAGGFAPCSVYFYIPKGSNELHMGYAGIENWVSTTGIDKEESIKFMREIDDEVIVVFEELGFDLLQQTGDGTRERQKVFKKAEGAEGKDAPDPDCAD